MGHRSWSLLGSCIAFATCVAVFFLTTGFIRGAIGDLAVVWWLFAGLGFLGIRSRPLRLALVGGLAFGLEFLQLFKLVAPDSPTWMHIVLGATFDPLDLLFYSVGLALAWQWDLKAPA